MKRITPHTNGYERDEMADAASNRAAVRFPNATGEGQSTPVAGQPISGLPYGHKGFWAQITGQGKIVGEPTYPGGEERQTNEMEYEWVMVVRYPPESGTGPAVWQSLDGESGTTDGRDGSELINERLGSVTDPDSGKIINPLIEEGSSRAVPVGAVVWAMPAELTSTILEDGSCWYSQVYLFRWEEGVRPFVLTYDHVPCQMVQSGGEEYSPYFPRMLQVFFADVRGWDSEDTWNVYPPATPEDAQEQMQWEDANQGEDPNLGPGPVVRNGVARVNNNMTTPNGWAKYVKQAWQAPEDDGNASPWSWEDQWHAVTVVEERLLEAEPVEDIAAGEQGAARLYWPNVNEDSGTAEVTDSSYAILLTNILKSDLHKDQRVKVVFDPDLYGWFPLKEEDLVGFELYDDLEPGGNAECWPWDGTSQGSVATGDPDTEPEKFYVYDTLHMHRGWGQSTATHGIGAKGFAVRKVGQSYTPGEGEANENRLVVVQMQPVALWVTGMTNYAVAPEDETFEMPRGNMTLLQPVGLSIDSVLGGGVGHETDDPVTVYNVTQLTLEIGDLVLMMWNDAQLRWETARSEVGSQWIGFELYDALAPGGTATAYAWDPVNGTDIGSGPVLTVNDSLYKHRGRGYHQFGSLSGSRGYAVVVEENLRIAIMQPNALMIKGTATAAVAPEDETFHIGYTTVQIMQPSGGMIVDQNPQSDIEVYNTFKLSIGQGDWGVAFWNEAQVRWETAPYGVSNGLTAKRFELTQDLSPGGSAYAQPREWVNGEWVTNENSQIVVYDVDKVFRGRRKNKFATPHGKGSTGLAVQNSDGGNWEIVEMQPCAALVRVEATSNAAPNTLTFTASLVEVMSPPGGIVVNVNPYEMVIHNTPQIVISAGNFVTVVWNDEQVWWEIAPVLDNEWLVRAQENWYNNNLPYVMAKRCTGVDGSGEFGIRLKVDLPRLALGDPNIITGDVLVAHLGSFSAEGPRLTATSPYLDGKIGDVKMFAGNPANIRPGWEIMDGSHNLSHGSGINMSDRFVRGGSTAGTGGGSDDHDHTLETLPNDDTTYITIISGEHEHHGNSDLAGEHDHYLTLDLTIYPGGGHTHYVVNDTNGTHGHDVSKLTFDVARSGAHTTSATSDLKPGHKHPVSIPHTMTGGNHGHPGTTGEDGKHKHPLTSLSVTVSPSGDHGHSIDATAVEDHTHPLSASVTVGGGTHDHGGSTGADDGHDHSVDVTMTVGGGKHNHPEVTVVEAGKHAHSLVGVTVIDTTTGAHGHPGTADLVEDHQHFVKYEGKVGFGGTHGHALIVTEDRHDHSVNELTVVITTELDHTHPVTGLHSTGTGEHDHKSGATGDAGMHAHSVFVAGAGGHEHSLLITDNLTTHTHTFTTDLGGYDGGFDTEEALTGVGVTVDDHPTHTHTVTSVGYMEGEGSEIYGIGEGDPETGSGGGDTHSVDVTDPQHSHAVTAGELAHDHDGTTDANEADHHMHGGSQVVGTGPHTHAASTDFSAGHTHTIDVIGGGSHSHGIGGSISPSGGHAHEHSSASGSTSTYTHSHSGSMADAQGTSHQHAVVVYVWSDDGGAHSHPLTIDNTGGGHSHKGTITGTTGYEEAHKHTVTVGSDKTEHTHSGPFATDTSYEEGHVHPVNATGSAHSHSGPVSGTASGAGGHGHPGSTTTPGKHGHTGTLSGSTGDDGIHTHPLNIVVTTGYHSHSANVVGDTSLAGQHDHVITVTGDGTHSHTGTATGRITGDGGHDHSPRVTGAGSHSHTGTVTGRTAYEDDHQHPIHLPKGGYHTHDNTKLPAHVHKIKSDSYLPKYMTLVFIERVDNSTH